MLQATVLKQVGADLLKALYAGQGCRPTLLDEAAQGLTASRSDSTSDRCAACKVRKASVFHPANTQIQAGIFSPRQALSSRVPQPRLAKASSKRGWLLNLRCRSAPPLLRSSR